MLSAFIVLVVETVKSDFVPKQTELFTQPELFNTETKKTHSRIDQEISALDG
jgi:hypothetical protein